MKYPFDLDNFESFLSEQADQHRMYAGDRVWRNIQERLHGKDRWPALTFASLLTVSIIAVLLTFTYPEKNLFNSPANYAEFVKASVISKASPEMETNKVMVTKQEPNALDLSMASNRVAAASGESTPVEYTSGVSESHVIIENEISQMDSEKPMVVQSVHSNEEKVISKVVTEETEMATKETKLLSSLGSFKFNKTQNNAEEVLINTPDYELSTEQQESIQQKAFIKNTMDYGPQIHNPISAKPSRWSLQLYGTPSVSYRYLLEDKKFEDDPASVTGPLAPYLVHSVNEFVTHKPKLGLEAGASVLYQLADNFRLKSGLQLNYRQYGIQAYAIQAQPALLTLERGNSTDSIIRYSSLSSQGGYRQVELTSSFVQLAVPIGFDLKVANIKKVDFYVSAAGQLTYQLSSSNYILSADYKNYLKQPDLDRKFNINTAVEAFASFEAGGVKWQAGPQIRYQLLPGSQNAYPIREHLVDYGFKIGVVKPLK